MALNRIIADSIADGTVVASDIADGTITLAKLQSGLLPPATANSAAAYANAAFATANTGSASGSYANSAFATANTGTAAGSYANSAFASANLISGVNTTQNTNITSAGSYANGAFIKANSSVSLTANVTGTLPVGNGGTGAATLTSNNVLIGNGASAVNFVAPGSSGNLLTSNGTTWTSAAPSGGVTSVNGQTGAVVATDFGGIGSTAVLMYGSTGTVGAGSTAPGSDLRHSYSTAQDFGVGGVGYGSSVTGTSLSGTWRHMGSGNTYSGCGPRYYYCLWCRVS